MHIQGWFPLGVTGLISLLPKGLSRVFSSTTSHQFFSTQLSLWLGIHHFSCVQLFVTTWTVAHQPPLEPLPGFSRQEYWSGLSSPPPGYLPDPRIELESPALQADSLATEPLGNPWDPWEPIKTNSKWREKTDSLLPLHCAPPDRVILCALKHYSKNIKQFGVYLGFNHGDNYVKIYSLFPNNVVKNIRDCYTFSLGNMY